MDYEFRLTDSELEAGSWCRDWRTGIRAVQRFRGGLVLKARRLLYHSTLSLRVTQKKFRADGCGGGDKRGDGGRGSLAEVLGVGGGGRGGLRGSGIHQPCVADYSGISKP